MLEEEAQRRNEFFNKIDRLNWLERMNKDEAFRIDSTWQLIKRQTWQSLRK